MLKKFLITTITLMGIFEMTAKDLKVLMIGNSFSICVLKFLPEIVADSENDSIDITSAYIGGCSLERHINDYDKAEQDANYKPYLITQRVSKDLDKKFEEYYSNLPELLQKEKWDIITIQQASHESWKYERYQPYADQLIEIIRQAQGQAEIVIQQTWSYRNDSTLIGGDNPTWGFDQAAMYERLASAYQTLAQKYGFRIIPTGLGVQNYRKLSSVTFTTLADLSKIVYPQLPSNSGDVVGSFYWNTETKPPKINADLIHLNDQGIFLQGCVWYGKLFDKDPEKITYYPDFLSLNEAKLIKKCAALALQ